jgi:hypothetical protein
MSPVTAMDEWPSRSATALIWTPASSQATAALCRSVCRSTPSTPALAAATSTTRRKLRGSTGVPSSVVKTRPVSVNPATDSMGNTFITYNPGRYDGGVLVLIPNAGGFEDIGWEDTGGSTQHYDGRHAYYYAQLVGPGAYGRYTIQQSRNDCTPSCAGRHDHYQGSALDWKRLRLVATRLAANNDLRESPCATLPHRTSETESHASHRARTRTGVARPCKASEVPRSPELPSTLRHEPTPKCPRYDNSLQVSYRRFWETSLHVSEVLGGFGVKSRCTVVDPRLARSGSEPATCTPGGR